MMKKTFLIVILVAIFLPFFAPTNVNAYSVNNRTEIGFDENLSDQTQIKYLEPKKILVSQVSTKSEELTQNTDEWIKSLYYYSITRLHFADIPYNYLVTRDGFIYKSKAGYDGVVPELQEPEGAVLIGYMSGSSDVTPAALKSISDLITDLSSKYAIARDSVQTVDLLIAQKQEPEKELSKLKYSLSTSAFSASMLNVYSLAKYSTTKVALAYTGEIKGLIFPTEIKADEMGNVKFTVVNKNDFPWFTDQRFIYVSTKNDKKTDMFVNGAWDSFARPTHIEEKTILPGEEYEMTFDVKAGLVTTESAVQDFKLIIEPNIKITGSDFAVNFKTVKGDFELIRIVLQPGYNYTNIRSCAKFECSEVSKASQGEIYAKYGEENGWYKIKYDNGKEGWISGQYAKVIPQ